MFVVWEKLKRLQPVLRNLSKPLMHLKQNILQARGNLQQAQLDLSIDLMNSTNIAKVKKYTDELIYFQELEENVLRQKAKIDWLKLGDGNNSFFYATVKSRANAKGMNMLRKIDGTVCATQEDIENLVLEFYGELMGKKSTNLKHIDADAMRRGGQLSMEQRQFLVAPVSDQEILKALNGIGDLKSPGIDGYGANSLNPVGILSKMISIMQYMTFSIMIDCLRHLTALL